MTVIDCLQHANSETGVLQDIQRVSDIARKKGVLFHTDAVQSVAKVPFSLKKFPVDRKFLYLTDLNIIMLFLELALPSLIHAYSPLCDLYLSQYQHFRYNHRQVEMYLLCSNLRHLHSHR